MIAYEKRRQVLKSIPKFWPVALMNHPTLSTFVQHTADQLALSYLEDLWVAKDPKEPRCFVLEFVRHSALCGALTGRLAAAFQGKSLLHG